MIEEGYKHNFETLRAAMKNDDCGIMEMVDAITKKRVIVIIALNRSTDGFIPIPLAKMFDGNPYEELDPPFIPEVISCRDEA